MNKPRATSSELPRVARRADHLAMVQPALASLESKIAEHCDTVTWVTTGIFTLSIFLSILRPDPTLTICLFGFYGACRE